jgi:phospholipase C
VGTGASTHSFDFSRLGVRVPTVVISPWIKPRTVVSTVFDHSSIIRTVLRLFVGDDVHLTDRDTDDDGTSFAIPAGTSVAASALVEVPIAS